MAKKTRGKKPDSDADQAPEASASGNRPDFLIAGVGASAGGIEALEALLRGLPEDAPLSLVIVQHRARGATKTSSRTSSRKPRRSR